MSSAVKPTRVISITSGKGGVGKTHTTVNLGLGLAKLGYKVLLLDADLGLANINIILGFETKANLYDVITGKRSLSEIIVQHKVGPDETRLDIIPAASGISTMTNLSETERYSLVSAFDDLSTSYDYLLVDTAAGIGDNVLYFNVAAEQVIVVVDPEPTSMTDAYALIKVLSTECNCKEFDIVVNRTPVGSDGRNVFAKLAAATGKFLPVRLNFLGSIADDPSLIKAVMAQTPVLQLYPGTKASRDYSRLAKNIADNQGLRTPKGGMQFFFRSLLEHSEH